MLRSLRFRLVLTVVAVAVVVAVAISLLTGLATQREFSRFVEIERETSGAPIDVVDVGPLAGHYERAEGWAGVEPVLRRLAEANDATLLLFDTDRSLVASTSDHPAEEVRLSDDETLEVTRTSPEPAGEQRMMLRGAQRVTAQGGRAIGLMFRLPDEPAPDPSPATGFTSSVKRWHYLGILGGALLALVLGLALSRRVVGPVERLTEAARAMERGDSGERVVVRSRDEIGELARAFNAMSAAVERQESLRRGMVSDVAHELRTPLTHMRCRLEAVQDGLAPQSEELVASLHEEVLHLGRLVDDLQELALAEAGQLRFSPEAFAVGPLVGQVVESLAASSDTTPITVDVREDLPLVTADPDRFRQVLRNLLSNALRHTPAGGRVTVTAATEGGSVRLQVADSGPGIPPEHLSNIFERFYRVDPSRDRAAGGSGLGLAIVRQLVLAWGGEIGAESEPGCGAMFSFTVPLSDEGW